jgi:hypothetical protein
MANLFPKSFNWLPLKIGFCVGVLGAFTVAGVWYYFTPKYTRVGYQPTQPVEFPHDLHATQLGMDCRYCHSFVEVSSHSNVPTTQTCMNCHSQVAKESAKLEPVRRSWTTGVPIKWVKVHRAPDYVYFNHSVHVNRGISCASCHGQVNHMPVVFHDQSQSMGWCLECHRTPENNIRPKEHVFDLDWKPAEGQDQKELGRKLVAEWNVNPPTNCSGCHR